MIRDDGELESDPREPGSVAVVVVTFDSAEFVARCLESVRSSSELARRAPLYLVDNASTDATVALARAADPRAEIVLRTTNDGFAAAVNHAVALATAAGVRFVYLLNPDAVAEPDFLDEALAVAGDDASVAAVQSLLLLEPERERIDSAGNRLHFLGFGYCDLHRRPATEAPTAPCDVAFASGAGVLLRLSALATLGGLREDLEHYCEDLDLGWRLRMAGLRSRLAPRSRVRHRHEFARHPRKLYLLERNRFLVLLANWSARSLVLLVPFLLANELAMAAVALGQGWLGAKLRSWGALLSPRRWRALRVARRHAQSRRVAGDREVAYAFTARMEVGEPEPVVLRIANPILGAIWRALARVI